MLQLKKDPAANSSLWAHFSHKLPVYDLSPYSRPKASATSLINAHIHNSNEKNRSYLSWHQYGKGSVVYLASPSTYHLRLLQGDRYHYRFWGQIFQWLGGPSLGSGTPQVRVRATKAQYAFGTPIHASVTLTDTRNVPILNAPVSLALTKDDETKMEVVCEPDPDFPGRYLATFETPPTGNFVLKPIGTEVEQLLGDHEASTPITVLKSVNRELDPGLASPATLREIAEASHGMIVPPHALASALENFSLHTPKSEHTVLKPLWNQWTLLLLIIAFLCLEWGGRRLAGTL